MTDLPQDNQVAPQDNQADQLGDAASHADESAQPQQVLVVEQVPEADETPQASDTPVAAETPAAEGELVREVASSDTAPAGSKEHAPVTDAQKKESKKNRNAKAAPQPESSADRDDKAKPETKTRFADLPLRDEVRMAVQLAGYDHPTPIQEKIIPFVLAGRDVLAQSQTGSGKTAAFALPILSRIDTAKRRPQALVLTPTRELAIQVANSFSTYGNCLSDFSVATIYGGQDYEPQRRQLRRGCPVVVGTPGRVIDHIRRGTLDISGLDCLVLDEADEMLNMGFLEDVQFVLKQTPNHRQIALFSATLPGPIQEIAQDYLNDPATVKIKKKSMTADSIRQRALFVAPRDKIRALCRILEAEPTDGVIVFTKTKAATMSVAESLQRQGLSSVALNGDMPQNVRERTVEQFKSGRLNILVATDVAARGLDVSRVSHVINFDLPHDAESYIHRVGRTGRAGRSGEAIIFLTNAQRGKLRLIERATKQRIEVVDLPDADSINQMRMDRFKEKITKVTAEKDLTFFKNLISEYANESGKPLEMIAAALAHIGQQGRPFLVEDRPARRDNERSDREPRDSRGFKNRDRSDGDDRRGFDERPNRRRVGPPAEGMQRYRIGVGRRDGVRPGNIVGAVANEAGIDGEFIGPILIHDSYSTVDLPEGMPRDIYQSLQRTWIAGKPMRLSLEDDRHDRNDRDDRPRKQKHRNKPGKSHGSTLPRAKSKRPNKGKPVGKSKPNGKHKSGGKHKQRNAAAK